MASKQLTATVKLNTSQAERKLKNIAQAIDILNRTVGRQTSAYNQVNNALKKTTRNTTTAKTETERWAASANKLNGNFRRTGSLIGTISGKLRGLVNTYLGVMGVKGMIGASDTLTSAENKLNYISAQQLGKAGTNADGTYSARTMYATQDAMNKMYDSSQKVRMSYADMMTNVSKSMALAGEAFGNSTDNAIRFQEIMAEAYAVGGASAAEMSSSMYQLMQALGSGTLAGDELRSVREGAPLAYKAIEEFAQGVYNTEESLKELGSQGKITSDMVVAAIMNAGNEMDKAFAQTEQTFAQTWSQIKNAALKSFRPVADMLRNTLNKAIDNGMIAKFETAFDTIAKIVMIVGKVIANVVSWIADNWSWLQHVMVAGLIILAGMWIWNAGVAVLSIIQILMSLSPLIWTILVIFGAVLSLVYVFYLWKVGAIDTCQAIVTAILIVGVAVTIVMAIITGGISLIPLLIAGLLALIFWFFEEVCGAAMWFAGLIQNLIVGLTKIVVFTINLVIGIIMWAVATGYNIFVAFTNSLAQLFYFIFYDICGGIIEWFVNAFNGGFDGIVGYATNAFGQLASMVLGGLKVITRALDAVAGTNFSEKITGWQDTAKSWGKKENATTFKLDEATMKRTSATKAFGIGMNSVQYDGEFVNLSEQYKKGAEWGAGLNERGSKYQNGFDFSLDDIGKKLGLDFSTFADDDYSNKLNALTDIIGNRQAATDLLNDNPEEAAKLLGGKGGKTPSDLLKGVNGINDNTSKIADSMDLTEEDLQYLRDVANMEWKKEFTTANITVDMSNYNTVNSDFDLDSLAISLRDKIEEEMYAVAEGVYVG